MKPYFSSLSLTNFRTFRERTEFEFAPLTILIGPNNSGKSSLAKAILLLVDNWKRHGFELLRFDAPQSSHGLVSFSDTRSYDSQNDSIGIAVGVEWGADTSGEIDCRNLMGKPYDPWFQVGEVLLDLEWEGSKSGGTGILDRASISTRAKSRRPLLDYRRLASGAEAVIHLSWFLNEHFFSDAGLHEFLSDAAFSIDVSDDSVWNHLETAFEEGHVRVETSSWKPWAAIQREIEFGSEMSVPSFPGVDNSRIEDLLLSVWATLRRNVIQPTTAYWMRMVTEHAFEQLGEHLPVSKFPVRRVYQSPELELFEYYDDDIVSEWLRKLGVAERLKLERLETAAAVSVIKDGRAISIADLGDGSAKLIPLIVAISRRGSDDTIMVEEPESGLHPRLQSMLADLFADFVKSRRGSAIVETHSEYLVRRLQYLVAKGHLNPNDVILYYLSDPAEPEPVRKINIKPSGQMTGGFGEGFYDESTSLMIDLMRLTAKN